MASQAGVFVRRLTGEEGQRLIRTAHTSRDQVAQRRATILLASAQGRSAQAIAGLIEGSVDYIREVIHAFNEHGFKTLDWTRNGANDGTRVTADPILGALAASPWPALLTGASRPLGSQRATRPVFEPPRPSPAVPTILQPPPGWAASRAPGRLGLGTPAKVPVVRHESAHVTADTHERPASGGEVGNRKVHPSESRHAVEPHRLDQQTTPTTAREPGCPCSSANGRNGRRKDDTARDDGVALADLARQRLDELERENARLRKERELLKTAAAFFAAESQKA